MKYYFVINPASGTRKNREKMLEAIRSVCEEDGIKWEIYLTKEAKDGERFVRGICEKHRNSGKMLRIYACGGDGTINETVNGAYGFDNVEIGAIPLGTGNDYIRNYGDAEHFLDIRRQLRGISRYSDLIGYRAGYDGRTTQRYCVNMFNIGFDCNVVDMTSRIKQLPFAKGPLAYLISVAIILIKKKGADLRIEYPDGEVIDGRILLIAIANGCYCGGGVKGVPYSITDDGMIDVSVVRDVTRRFFVRLFPSYSKGIHLENEEMLRKNVIRYTKVRGLTVVANGESLRLCTDGEITTQKKIEFFVADEGFKFIVPEGL